MRGGVRRASVQRSASRQPRRQRKRPPPLPACEGAAPCGPGCWRGGAGGGSAAGGPAAAAPGDAQAAPPRAADACADGAGACCRLPRGLPGGLHAASAASAEPCFGTLQAWHAGLAVERGAPARGIARPDAARPVRQQAGRPAQRALPRAVPAAPQPAARPRRSPPAATPPARPGRRSRRACWRAAWPRSGRTPAAWRCWCPAAAVRTCARGWEQAAWTPRQTRRERPAARRPQAPQGRARCARPRRRRRRRRRRRAAAPAGASRARRRAASTRLPSRRARRAGDVLQGMRRGGAPMPRLPSGRRLGPLWTRPSGLAQQRRPSPLLHPAAGGGDAAAPRPRAGVAGVQPVHVRGRVRAGLRLPGRGALLPQVLRVRRSMRQPLARLRLPQRLPHAPLPLRRRRCARRPRRPPQAAGRARACRAAAGGASRARAAAAGAQRRVRCPRLRLG